MRSDGWLKKSSVSSVNCGICARGPPQKKLDLESRANEVDALV